MMKVLIADDSDETRLRLVRIVKGVPGIEVVGVASGGREVVCLAQRHNPDGVILDLRMPEGNGFYALNALKTAHPNLLVIVLTNYAEPVFAQRCVSAGADHFLDKSHDFDKLPEILRRWAEQSAVERVVS